ncbi:hypothetical protein P7H15_01645 [Paenibacillus larvae]|nr:hypothetical protein [Paenibacillus larvae]MDT2291879.1 hypothetical protein [Paenibacillus larvae]
MPRTWNATGAIAIRSEGISQGSWAAQGSAIQKPTYTLAAADPKEKQRHFTETTFPELKKSY